VTWEKAWHTPCENSGVICVGGLGFNNINKDPQSNFGHEDVSIFAPFNVLVGPDPDNPDPNTARLANGTSFSTPYTAGVAGLIWAAEPSLSADEVEDILMRNMRSSADNKVGHRVIQAFDAVKDALPAAVTIQKPTGGQTLSPFQPTQFSANVFADGLGTPTVTWRRNGATVIGTGTDFQATLPVGNHTITATAVFPNGTQTADAVAVAVVDHVPAMTITSPVPNVLPLATFQQSESIPFHATSLDDLGQLPDSQVKWYLDGATTPFATGHNPFTNTGAAIGLHTATIRGCDAANQCGNASVHFVIQSDGANLPPSAHITNPTHGAVLWVNGSDANGWYHELTLAGTVSDPENAPVSVAWLDNGTQIATSLNPTVRLAGGCGNYNHHLTLRVTDNAGTTRQDVVQVTVALVC
jgi:hypothetical protein